MPHYLTKIFWQTMRQTQILITVRTDSTWYFCSIEKKHGKFGSWTVCFLSFFNNKKILGFGCLTTSWDRFAKPTIVFFWRTHLSCLLNTKKNLKRHTKKPKSTRNHMTNTRDFLNQKQLLNIHIIFWCFNSLAIFNLNFKKMDNFVIKFTFLWFYVISYHQDNFSFIHSIKILL